MPNYSSALLRVIEIVMFYQPLKVAPRLLVRTFLYTFHFDLLDTTCILSSSVSSGISYDRPNYAKSSSSTWHRELSPCWQTLFERKGISGVRRGTHKRWTIRKIRVEQRRRTCRLVTSLFATLSLKPPFRRPSPILSSLCPWYFLGVPRNPPALRQPQV